MTPRRDLPALLALTVLGTLVLAASAQASSIVYIKRGDVWLAKSNGTASARSPPTAHRPTRIARPLTPTPA